MINFNIQVIVSLCIVMIMLDSDPPSTLPALTMMV